VEIDNVLTFLKRMKTEFIGIIDPIHQ